MYGSLERGGTGRPEFMESGERSGLDAVPGKLYVSCTHRGNLERRGMTRRRRVTGIPEAESACPSVEIVILSD